LRGGFGNFFMGTPRGVSESWTPCGRKPIRARAFVRAQVSGGGGVLQILVPRPNGNRACLPRAERNLVGRVFKCSPWWRAGRRWTTMERGRLGASVKMCPQKPMDEHALIRTVTDNRRLPEPKNLLQPAWVLCFLFLNRKHANKKANIFQSVPSPLQTRPA
jgi:hypothetical protein